MTWAVVQDDGKVQTKIAMMKKMNRKIEMAQKEEEISALEKWQPLYADELQNVDNVIIKQTSDGVDMIENLVKHIISSGGKRLRPILTILSSKMCGYSSGERHIKLAAAIEFLHTATLLHDDVVDESDLRRGKSTANNIWGNSASVLVGDFLLSRAFQLMSQDGNIRVLSILSDASAIITEGEVKQLMAVSDITTTEEEYIDIVASKTAQLFAAACRIGAVIAERPKEEEYALEEFGQNLGIAFQIIDDALDYSSSQEKLGKTIGDDFREGKITLPVILAYSLGNNEEKDFWENAVKDGEKNLANALMLMEKHNVIDKTTVYAERYVQKAISAFDIFPDTQEKTSMLELLDFSLNRLY